MVDGSFPSKDRWGGSYQSSLLLTSFYCVMDLQRSVPSEWVQAKETIIKCTEGNTTINIQNTTATKQTEYLCRKYILEHQRYME